MYIIVFTKNYLFEAKYNLAVLVQNNEQLMTKQTIILISCTNISLNMN